MSEPPSSTAPFLITLNSPPTSQDDLCNSPPLLPLLKFSVFFSLGFLYYVRCEGCWSVGLLVGGDGARDGIRGGVCLEQPMVRLWWGVKGLGRMGSGMGGRVGRGEGLGVTEMLCYGGCRVYGSNWGAKFPVASLGYVVPYGTWDSNALNTDLETFRLRICRWLACVLEQSSLDLSLMESKWSFWVLGFLFFGREETMDLVAFLCVLVGYVRWLEGDVMSCEVGMAGLLGFDVGNRVKDNHLSPNCQTEWTVTHIFVGIGVRI